MRAGYASSDITPAAPVTLSGFAARKNRICGKVSDPLSVRTLVVEHKNECVALLSFDLLGLGPQITEAIHARLDSISGFPAGRNRRVLACTHTHSAPAAIRLIGCGIEEAWYAEDVVDAAAKAAAAAAASMRPATMKFSVHSIPGANYNRRRVLSNGRVSMSFSPNAPVVKEGPVWNRMTLVRFDDEKGEPIAGVIHWACHACTAGENAVSADYPGELVRQLSETQGVPFTYLQGACGNLNPPLGKMTRADMLRNVAAIVKQIGVPRWSGPVNPEPFGMFQDRLQLEYGRMPSSEEAAAFGDGMREIARTGNGPENLIAVLADIMNVEPGQEPEPAMLKHIAGALAEWSESIGAGSDTACPLWVAAWRTGPLVWCFAAAELFAETAIALQNLFPDLVVNTVAYCAPLVGYLPTDEALAEGGYEVEYAYRFYGHPAPFARGSEPAVAGWMRDAVLRSDARRGQV